MDECQALDRAFGEGNVLLHQARRERSEHEVLYNSFSVNHDYANLLNRILAGQFGCVFETWKNIPAVRGVSD